MYNALFPLTHPTIYGTNLHESVIVKTAEQLQQQKAVQLLR
jgi:hypothetical protein